MADEPQTLTVKKLQDAFNDQLDRWARADPNPSNRQAAQDEITRRARIAQEERAGRPYVPVKVEDAGPPVPFDPRTEVSADAKHIASRIVTHLWIIFIALPIAAWILYEIASTAR
jgi:hypothetical protein